MTDRIIRKSIYLRASKEHVWAYLTDPQKLAIWFHVPTAPLKSGDSYVMHGAESGKKLMWGDVRTAQPYDLLEYSFTITPMGEAVSWVTWRLEEVAGGTRLSLEHRGLPEGEESFGLTLALDEGWDEHLGRMRTALHDT